MKNKNLILIEKIMVENSNERIARLSCVRSVWLVGCGWMELICINFMVDVLVGKNRYVDAAVYFKQQIIKSIFDSSNLFEVMLCTLHWRPTRRCCECDMDFAFAHLIKALSFCHFFKQNFMIDRSEEKCCSTISHFSTLWSIQSTGSAALHHCARDFNKISICWLMKTWVNRLLAHFARSYHFSNKHIVASETAVGDEAGYLISNWNGKHESQRIIFYAKSEWPFNNKRWKERK